MQFNGVDAESILALERFYCLSFSPVPQSKVYCESLEEMQPTAKDYYHSAYLMWTLPLSGYQDKAIAEIKKAIKLDKNEDFQLFAAFRMFLLDNLRDVSKFA